MKRKGFERSKSIRDQVEQGELEEVEKKEFKEPMHFGSFAHEAYGLAAADRYENSETEQTISVLDEEGFHVNDGRIDLIVGEKNIVDFKTNDMREWTTEDAVKFAKEHGEQVQGYMNSPDTPEESKGLIVSSVPPKNEEVRKAYAEALADFGVEVGYSSGEDQDSVMEVVDSFVSEVEPDPPDLEESEDSG